MSKSSLLMLAAVIALGACSASANSNAALPPAQEAVELALETPMPLPAPAPAPALQAAHADYAAVSCDVRSRRTANGVVIQARAFADSDFDGEYDLTIRKSGANQADISQGGEVSLAAGSSATLGENEISLERGSRIRATLTLTDANGRVCRRTLNL